VLFIDVPPARSENEWPHKAMACDRRTSAIGDALPGAGHDLARVRLFEPEDVRDVAIWVVERLPQDIGGSFCASEPFNQ
jgi:hypothetical protein